MSLLKRDLKSANVGNVKSVCLVARKMLILIRAKSTSMSNAPTQLNNDFLGTKLNIKHGHVAIMFIIFATLLTAKSCLP